MSNAIQFNREEIKSLISFNFLLVILISIPSAIIAEYLRIPLAFDLDPNFVAFHHIIRLLFILFMVPIILKIIKSYS